MLTGIAHVHFREGERGSEEASLGFDEAMAIIEGRGIRRVVATFHVRHPTDLQPAMPRALLALIQSYEGPASITLMPEANMVLRGGGGQRIGHDIEAWRELDLPREEFAGMVRGWIVSAHFTKLLGWTKDRDKETAPEQTYPLVADLYEELMQQPWQGWIGHPFRHCAGDGRVAALRRLYRAAAETGRAVEVVAHHVEEVALMAPEAIAEFSHRTDRPLVAIAVDAHQRSQLEAGIDQSYALADLLIARGVWPSAIWNWED